MCLPFVQQELIRLIVSVFDVITQILGTDFEIGHFLRSRIIPKAVLYYTGDIVDDEDEDFDVRLKVTQYW